MKEEKKINKQIFFTIVVPVYNVEKYLDRCIESILNQKFDDFEVILVDDGSTDKSSKICDNYRKKDDKIIVIHKKNEGLGFARNTGIDKARGNYILFVDSDDYIDLDLLENLYNEIERNNSDAVFYGHKRVNNKKSVISTFEQLPDKQIYLDKNEIKNKLLAEFILNKKIFISAWSLCIKLSLLKKNNILFPSEREFISEDIYFLVVLFNYLNIVSFAKKTYYYYCQNENSLTTTYKKDRYEKIKKFYKKTDELLELYNYSNITKMSFKRSFISNVIACLKMIAANKDELAKNKIRKIKEISGDDYFLENVKKYDFKNEKKSWKIFDFLVKYKLYVILYICLKKQYDESGI